MALLLQLRTKPKLKPKHLPFTNPSLLLFSKFSSSSSSCLRDLKHTLKQQQQQQQRQPQQSPSTPSTQSSFTNTLQQQQLLQQPSLDEIRRNLSEFRCRTASSPPAEPVSFREFYNRTVLQKPPEPDGDSSGSAHGGRRPFTLDAIRDSLPKLGAARPGDRKGADPVSLAAYKEVLRLRPSDSSAESSPENAIGGPFPESVLGREKREKREKDESAAMAMAAARSEFVRIYSYGELGEKLRKLRPSEGKGKGKEWFSIGELNERLMRLREMEEKEAESNIKGGVTFKDLRECLIRINETTDEKSRKSSRCAFS